MNEIDQDEERKKMIEAARRISIKLFDILNGENLISGMESLFLTFTQLYSQHPNYDDHDKDNKKLILKVVTRWVYKESQEFK